MFSQYDPLIRDCVPMEEDIPFIQYLLQIIEQANIPLLTYCDLNEEVPIVVVDKEVLKNE